MRTNLCSLLDTEKPIISAPLGGAAGPNLVAAVSEAGGFGVIPLWCGIQGVNNITVENGKIKHMRAYNDPTEF